MADQTERSFQKQPTVFLNRKKGIGVKRSRKPLRYHKDVGLGFKTPRETEKAFQKQATVFLNRKGGLKRKDMRHHKNVGLGFKTPREAIEGTYIDKKCPFTGNVSIRGRILTGVVQKMKMQRTIVIRRDYLHYVKKYNRFEKRHKNMSVHLSPCFRSQLKYQSHEADKVVVVQHNINFRATTWEDDLPKGWRRDVELGDIVTIGECRPLSKTAIEGTYIDKKCPFTGNVSIRGRILTGVVQKMKMQRTIVIRRDYLHYVKKYNRFEKRHKNMSVHLSPCFRDVELGDIVTIGECRPLSKTVRFNVLKVSKGKGSKKSFKKF
ncbi:40S ribosomal protein S11 [Papilio machaon]|uniref:Small ribosomal subunit protein uS17 n=1 Tax=Papilio machaon TaxID=76193 RepID=A0A0N1IIY8_PAPMA|nr:40S ribosomal protein S11 [Papilio machaon]